MQQHNGAQAVYSLDAHANGEKFCVHDTVRVRIAAVSNVLTEFGCFRRQCIVATHRIPLDRIGNQTAPRPIAQQVDWLLESFRGACCALPMWSPPKRNHGGVRFCKLGTFSPVLHVTVVLLCWLCKLGIVSGTLRVAFVDRCRMHPVVLVFAGCKYKHGQWQQYTSTHQTAIQRSPYCVFPVAYFSRRN